MELKFCKNCGQKFLLLNWKLERRYCSECQKIPNLYKRIYDRKRHKRNREKELEYKRKWNIEKKDQIKKRRHKFYLKNQERLRWASRIDYKKNKRKRNQTRMRSWKKQFETDPKFRLNNSIKSYIHHSLKNKGGKKGNRKWEILVGYSLGDLVKHLENKFDENMNWNNYGSYWSIDHKKPKSLFNYTCPEDPEFKECWALSNLQPMEKITNLKKSNKYDKTRKT